MSIRRRRFGIRARVVTSFLVLLLAAEVISVAVLYQVTSSRQTEEANRDLLASVDEFHAQIDAVQTSIGTSDGPTIEAVLDDVLTRRPARRDEAFVAFVGSEAYASSAGVPVALESLDIAGEWPGLRSTRTGRSDTPVGAMRWLAVPIGSGDRTVGVFVAARFLGEQQDALRSTVITVSAVTLLVLVGAALLAWGAAGRAMSPLRDLARAAQSVTSSGDLTARIDVTSTDEVGALASSLNAMMSRLQVAFDSQKVFLDDAGHELRTPITIVRGHLELLDDDPDERAAEIALMLDELDRMDRLVTDLRMLARSERPDFLDTEPLEVDPFVVEIGRKAEHMATRNWVIRSRTQSLIAADRQRLTQALLNIIGNAIHVTAEGSTIEIGAHAGHGLVTFRITDHGPGIDRADRANLFDRTGRNVRHRPGGTGLGLPIAAAVARAHGGTISVTSEVGGGASFDLALPGGAR